MFRSEKRSAPDIYMCKKKYFASLSRPDSFHFGMLSAYYLHMIHKASFSKNGLSCVATKSCPCMPYL